jgi:hypothetical protein
MSCIQQQCRQVLWLMDVTPTMRYLSSDSICHGPTTVSSLVGLLPGIFRELGKAVVPISAFCPHEIIPEMFKINDEGKATFHSHEGMFSVRTKGFLLGIPRESFCLF